MKLTRRDLAAALLAPAAAAQTPPPQTPADPVEAARARIKANGEILSKIDIPMNVEPAFQFKA